MAVKVYFNNQIHRFAKLPQNLQALLAHIASLFKSELPASWVLQYVDSDGDHIIVSHEHDFKELVELESANPNTTIKLHVLPSQGGVSTASVETTHKEPAKYPQFGEYEVISQNKEEKTAIADSNPEEKKEAEPQVTFKPNKKECKHQFKAAKELAKKILKGKGDETEKAQLVEELNKLREALPEEDRERFDKKRAKLEAKFAMFGGHPHFGHHRGGHHGHHHRGGHHHGPHPGFHHGGPFGHHGGPFAHHGPHHQPHHSPKDFEKVHESSEERGPGCDKKNWKMKFFAKGGFGGFGGFGGRGQCPAGPGFGPFGGFGRFKHHDEKGFGFFKILKLFKKLFKAQKEGNTEKVAAIEAKLFEIAPEDARPVLKAILDSLPKDLDKKVMKERLIEGAKGFIAGAFPEGKDKIMEEFEKMQEKRKERKEKFRAMFEEKKKMFGENWHEKKEELKGKYSESVFRKSMKMKMIFVNDEIGAICEYVSKKPEEATLEELVLNYRQ